MICYSLDHVMYSMHNILQQYVTKTQTQTKRKGVWITGIWTRYQCQSDTRI